MGAVMVATAVAVYVEADIRFQAEVADKLPGLVVNPAGALERSDAVERRLTKVRGEPRFAADPAPGCLTAARPRSSPESRAGSTRSRCPCATCAGRSC